MTDTRHLIIKIKILEVTLVEGGTYNMDILISDVFSVLSCVCIKNVCVLLIATPGREVKTQADAVV